jgi:hypothetical protein
VIAVPALLALLTLAPQADPPPEATRIMAEALRGESSRILADLTDGVGARLAGSPGADAAVRWAVDWFRAQGIPVRAEPVLVTHWIRGEERAEVVARKGGRPQPLTVTALGMSAPTPPGEKAIPAAALSVEDAELLHRLLARGPVTVRLFLGGHLADPPLAPSANVVAEILGSEKPEEVVVIGAHLDSWDLGTGAIDDGAGAAMVLDTMRIAASMPRPPRRTLRAVLFMNEENGGEGAVAYHEASLAAGTRHVAAMEADAGAGRPTGVDVTAGQGGMEAVRAMAAPLDVLGASRVGAGGGGVDISPLAYAGVPLLSLAQETSRYFDWHHSAADTFDKVEPRALAEATAAFAWMAWALADSPVPLPPAPIPSTPPWWKRAAP